MVQWKNGGASGTYSPWWGNETKPTGKLDTVKLKKGLIPEAYEDLCDLMKNAHASEIKLTITQSYRSYTEQSACVKPTCATPGNSVHGTGRAIDIGWCKNDEQFERSKATNGFGGVGIALPGGFNGEAFEWLWNNAHKYNWISPPWAQIGNSRDTL